MITRRRLFELTGGVAALAGSNLGSSLTSPGHAEALKMQPALPEGTREEALLETLPGKKPLIKLSYRPPNYETPLSYFGTPITPNEAFFVRYHLSDIPKVDANTWRVELGGDGASGPAQLSLDDLKALPASEVVAVCQCSGNRRGLFQPHAPGVEWGYGAMGCARWKGVRLKEVLDRVGLKHEAVEIVFNGAEGPVVNKTPDFVKSIPVWKALEDTTLIAYEMNGAPLPHWNGFPARIIVPGWTGTYWVKHVTSIDAVTKPFDGYWMKSAYRIPLGKFPVVARFVSQDTASNTPITEMVVNSLITSPVADSAVRLGSTATISGLAWDGGYGVQSVEVSIDDGRSWTQATLGQDLGRFAFRPWKYSFVPHVRGKYVVKARATNQIGQTQTTQLIPNPAGYHHNLIQSLTLDAV